MKPLNDATKPAPPAHTIAKFQGNVHVVHKNIEHKPIKEGIHVTVTMYTDIYYNSSTRMNSLQYSNKFCNKRICQLSLLIRLALIL